MSLALIAGLGNPGPEYAGSRHNIGFVVVDMLAKTLVAHWAGDTRHRAEVARAQCSGKPVMLAKPQTFMNDSGRALGPLLRYYKLPPEALCVVYDDITLAPGALKITRRGSAGGHNGLASVLQHVGEGFVRYRVGIGGKPHPRMELRDYVLGKFSECEQSEIGDRLPALVAGLQLLVSRGPVEAMNQLNRRVAGRAAPPVRKADEAGRHEPAAHREEESEGDEHAE